ncbi:MAG: ABC transporter permease [Isosphaeraceae bacterium]|nr:ABC transporter permease [Isosphaeraceae bacterium]
MIPLKYNVRNLRVRRVTTALTVLGTGLLVWASCLLFGMVESLQHTQSVSGDPLDLLILRKGSSNETTGGFAGKVADEILTLEGIARDEGGAPLGAPELLNIALAEAHSGGRTNIIVRGVSPASPKLRRNFQVVQGRYLEPGKGECIVSRNLASRFKGSNLGGTLRVGEKESYRVVGLFTSGGTAAESEVWVDIADLRRNTAREDTVSSVQLRATSVPAMESLMSRLDREDRFKLAALRESEYYAQQSKTSLFLKVAGSLIAVLLTVGAMFAAANTMYAAVSSRTREIGTMRALGFSRFDILVSFLFESVLLCVLGGVLGLLAMLPMSALKVGFTDFNSFADQTLSFRMGPLVMAVAVTMTLAMGVFGGLFPALRAVRLDVIRALREL